MRRAESIARELAGHLSFAGATVVDVGCGTGDTSRWLARQGARVVGVDRYPMVALAAAAPRQADERYVAGAAQDVPLRASSADLMLYLASLHHVPRERMADAVAECARVLRPGGWAAVLEPVGLAGSYYEVVRLEEDEREVQRLAQEALETAPASGLCIETEGVFYVERSFADYQELMAVSVPEPERRARILDAAREVTARMAAEAEVAFDEFRFRSVCRLKVFRRRPARLPWDPLRTPA